MKNKLFALFIILVSFGVLGCDSDYDAEIAEYFNENDTKAPGAVTDLSANVLDRRTQLTWTNPTDKDFDGVLIECSPAEGSLSLPVYLTSFSDVPAYTVYNLHNGTPYSISFTTRDDNGNESSKVTTTVTPAAAIINPVTSLSATADDASMTLSWTNPLSDDFEGVNIKCTPAEGSISNPIYVKGVSTYKLYNLTNGTTYEIEVSAQDKFGNVSSAATLTAAPAATVNSAPATVTGLKASASDSQISITWTNPTDADFEGVLVSCSYNSSNVVQPVYLTSFDTPPTYTFYDLTNSYTYTISVIAKDTAGNKSAEATTTAVPAAASINPVTVLSAIEKESALQISWTNPSDTSFAGVHISCTPAAGSLLYPVYITTMPNPPTYTIYNLSNTMYKITVTAQDVYGNISDETTTTGTPLGGSPNSTGDISCSSFTPYKLDKTAVDIGYCSYGSNTMKNITLSNSGSTPIDISGMKVTNTAYVVKAYTDYTKTTETTTIPANNNVLLEIKYTPTSASAWDEETLDLTGTGTYSIVLIGSGFKQPNNYTSLALWLRSDMISSSDKNGSLVTNVPDYSGKNFDAKPYSPSTAPTYTASGINGLPTVTFMSQKYLVTSSSPINPVTYQAVGTTTFIVYKPNATVNQTRSLLYASYGVGPSYPCFYTNCLYWDKSAGHSSTWKTSPWVNGNGLSTARYPYEIDTSGDYSNTNTVDVLEASSSIAYSATLMYDSEAIAPSDNIFMWTNGKKKGVSYITSFATSTYTAYTTNNSNNNSTLPGLYNVSNGIYYGSYGKPISNGSGGWYGDLGRTSAITVDTTTAGIGGTNKNRQYDYGFNNSTSYAGYLSNRLTVNDNGFSGTITSLYIGYSPVGGSYYMGDIAEVFIFSSALSDDDVNALNNYIHYRYGIGVENN